MSESPRARPMTLADYVAVYGELPRHTMIGWTAELDGVPVGVGGVAFIDNMPTLIAKMTDALRPHRRFIVQAARILARRAREYNAVAIADPALPLAPKLLSRMGMVHAGRCRHGEVYAWKR